MDNREKILYDDGTHKCVMFSFDDESHEDSFLSVNQYLIVQNGVGILIDPGSEVIFDELYDAVSRHVEIKNIKFIMPSLWVRFMSHYAFMDMSRVMSLSDHGAKLKFGSEYLKFVPAHFLHSPGNFSLYDSRSKILFSRDIGAAVVNAPNDYKYVQT